MGCHSLGLGPGQARVLSRPGEKWSLRTRTLWVSRAPILAAATPISDPPLSGWGEELEPGLSQPVAVSPDPR
jgi:hypothetical protein